MSASLFKKYSLSWPKNTTNRRAIAPLLLLIAVVVVAYYHYDYGILVQLPSPFSPPMIIMRNKFLLWLVPPPFRRNNPTTITPTAEDSVIPPPTETELLLLRDDPIEIDSGSIISYLDGDEWVVTSPDYYYHHLPPPPLQHQQQQKSYHPHHHLAAVVPGDLITDLERAGVINDPYYELNWIHNASLWSDYTWVYQRNFTVPSISSMMSTTMEAEKKEKKSFSYLLVFDGVKMGATVSINGVTIGQMADQFLRYTFQLDPSILVPEQSNQFLEVSFPGNNNNSNNIPEEGRFMACTGGWDWAPYSYTTAMSNISTNRTKRQKINTFSKGIWKSVYLLALQTTTTAAAAAATATTATSVAPAAAAAPPPPATTTPVAIMHMTPHTKYLGRYPTEKIENLTQGFSINVTVHLWVPGGRNSNNATGILTVAGSWSNNDDVSGVVHKEKIGAVATTAIQILPPGETKISLQLFTRPDDQIQLWWPTGMGEQPLYNVTATWRPATTKEEDCIAAAASYGGCDDSGGSSSSDDDDDDDDDGVAVAARRIGFRVFALVTTNDTDSNNVVANETADGSDDHGMFFRINGAAVYSRGANMVPMEELEGRMSGEAYRILVKSAADAHMNTLRVWGGGIYYPQVFYDACDEFGIMIYHDMQYASDYGGSHGPMPTAMQEAELRHQIRRLSHHPSIVMWDGCNEVVVTPNTPSEIFATFVMATVAQEDQSRAIWPSSPAAGWVTGVNRLYGTPNSNNTKLTTHGGGHIWDQGIETHAPYQLGSGWPSINGGPDDECWDRWNQVHTPPILDPSTEFGVQAKNVYASEFGVTGSPSFESLSATLAPAHWGIHGGTEPDNCTGACQTKRNCTGSNAMAQRNYACDAGIRKFMGTTGLQVSLDSTGELALKGQTYLCQLVQALDQKSVIEGRRGQNQMGALVWMLNDIWPSISWGSLEYGCSGGFTPGQLLGGRWKPMHYFYKRSLFTDVMSTCGIRHGTKNHWICYVKNDRAGYGFNGTVTLRSYELMGDGTPEVFLKHHLILPPGPGSVGWFSPPNDTMPNPNTTAMVSTVHDNQSGGTVLSEHLLSLTLPRHLLVPRAKVTWIVSKTTNNNGTIDVHVTSDRVALWVTLTSLAHGRFSDNAFFLPATTKVVLFVPFRASPRFRDGNMKMLQTSLRVEDFSMYGPIAIGT